MNSTFRLIILFDITKKLWTRTAVTAVVKKKTKKLNKQKRFKPFRTFLHRPLPKELFFGRKFMLTWSVIWIHRNWYTFHVCNTFSKQLHAAFILSSFLWLSLISAHISKTNSRKLLSILLLWCQTRRLRFWLFSI